MIEILKFIFSSFWVWLGSLIMLAVIVQGLCAVFGHSFSLIRIGGSLVNIGSGKKAEEKKP